MSGRDRFEAREEEIEADDYRAFFDSAILRVWHLQGKERTYRITRVTALTSEVGQGRNRKQTRQPKLELATRKGAAVPLPLLLNKTNAKTIAQLYGKRPSDWVGRWITLYPSTTDVGGETLDCIRIRNEIPGAGARRNRQGANVLPPAVPPSEPASLDHERGQLNEDGDADDDGAPNGSDDADDDSLDADCEVVQ